jgi:hypothetical protein
MRWGEMMRWAALVPLLVLVVGTPSLAAQSPPLTPPGETVPIAPGQTVVFVHQSARVQGATRDIEVTNWGDVAGTALSDGYIITLTLPVGSTIQADVVYEGLGGELVPCLTDSRMPHVARCAPQERRATQASVRFRAVPARATIEELRLVTGCNNVSVTWPDGTATALVASAVLPRSGLESIWLLDANRGRFIGWSPTANAPNDLLTVRRLEAVYICMRGPGILARPAI